MNDLSGNPFLIDTVTPQNGAPFSGIVGVLGIRWIAPSGASGNQAIISDPKTGKVLWQDVLGPNDKAKESIIQQTWQNGFYASQIDTGTVEVYTDRKLLLSIAVPSVGSTL